MTLPEPGGGVGSPGGDPSPSTPTTGRTSTSFAEMRLSNRGHSQSQINLSFNTVGSGGGQSQPLASSPSADGSQRGEMGEKLESGAIMLVSQDSLSCLVLFVFLRRPNTSFVVSGQCNRKFREAPQPARLHSARPPPTTSFQFSLWISCPFLHFRQCRVR